MHDLTSIKQRASTNTIYTEQHPQGIAGFIHWTGKRAIYCLPVGEGYTWYVQGKCVRESDIASLLAGD